MTTENQSEDICLFPGERIEATLRAGREVLTAGALLPEVPDVGLQVERHRWTWKPDVVRVLLIAESHVYTSAADLACRIRPELLPPEARHAPAEFVRLIYCLGYGENSLLSSLPEGRNSGTPQFWNIFGRVAGTGRQPTRQSASWQERIAWKVGTLKAMQDAGVWLLDASLHGIYAPSAARVAPRITQRLHEIWWRGYGEWLVSQYPGAYRCVIGRGVSRGLEEIGIPVDGWIYQPQARATAGTDLEAGWSSLLEAVRP